MEFTRDLKFGLPLLRGDDVRLVQQALERRGVVPPCGAIDGVFGKQTGAAVAAFQSGWNTAKTTDSPLLDVTGKVDAATWAVLLQRPEALNSSPIVLTSAGGIPGDLAKDVPLTRTQVGRLKKWMETHFKAEIEAAIADTPMITLDLVCAIAAKESAIYWIGHIDRLAPDVILRLCVFDASGDVPGTARKAFPVNAEAFRRDPRYGELTDELIAAGNEMRRVLRGFGPAAYLYKGYGIFQYDLQNIEQDEGFFRGRLWSEFGACIGRFKTEMREKLRVRDGNLEQAVRAYNGSGPRAERYERSVMLMRDWCSAVA